MTPIFNYMTESEKDLVITENTVMQYNTDYAILCLEHEQRLNDIDTEALVSNYTESDLTDLYTKEMKVFTEATQSLWQKFKAWIKGIIDAIFKTNKDAPITSEDKGTVANSEEAKKGVELPVNPKKARPFVDSLKKAVSAVTQSLFKKNDGSGKLDVKKTVAVAATTAVVGGGATAAVITLHKARKDFVQPTVVTGDDLIAASSDLTEVAKDVEHIIDSVRDESAMEILNTTVEGAEGNNIKSGFSVISLIQSAINKLKNFKNKILKKGDKPAEDKAQDKSENNTDNEKKENNATAKFDIVKYAVDKKLAKDRDSVDAKAVADAKKKAIKEVQNDTSLSNEEKQKKCAAIKTAQTEFLASESSFDIFEQIVGEGEISNFFESYSPAENEEMNEILDFFK
jgi:hypothetical protein